MKAILNFKRVLLMVLMFAVVPLSAFANNANENNSVNRNGDYSLFIPANPETTTYSMDIVEGAEGFITIVPPVGYTVYGEPIQIQSHDGGSVEIISDDSRGVVIRFIARYRGITILRVTLITVGEGSGGFTIDIVINVTLPKGKS